MKPPAFAYRVDDRGSVFRGAKLGTVEAPKKSAQVFVDGVQRPQGWLSHFDRPERDLLRVTAAVLDLDRLSRRRPHVRAEKREICWRRAISVEIAVEDLVRWRAVQGELSLLLAFLTDDIWTFTFVNAERFHELAAFEHHAKVLARIETFTDLTDLDPNARHVFKASLGSDLSPDGVRSRTIEMYRRYAREIDHFPTAARPSLNARKPRPAKEVVHDLFSAAR